VVKTETKGQKNAISYEDVFTSKIDKTDQKNAIYYERVNRKKKVGFYLLKRTYKVKGNFLGKKSRKQGLNLNINK
jgi:putative methionine-R-sulfoxide reductase with GAF domain